MTTETTETPPPPLRQPPTMITVAVHHACDIHVLPPPAKTREHVMSEHCWCGPQQLQPQIGEGAPPVPGRHWVHSAGKPTGKIEWTKASDTERVRTVDNQIANLVNMVAALALRVTQIEGTVHGLPTTDDGQAPRSPAPAPGLLSMVQRLWDFVGDPYQSDNHSPLGGSLRARPTEWQVRELIRHEVAMLQAEESFRRSIRGRIQKAAEWLGQRMHKSVHVEPHDDAEPDAVVDELRRNLGSLG